MWTNDEETYDVEDDILLGGWSKWVNVLAGGDWRPRSRRRERHEGRDAVNVADVVLFAAGDNEARTRLSHAQRPRDVSHVTTTRSTELCHQLSSQSSLSSCIVGNVHEIEEEINHRWR